VAAGAVVVEDLGGEAERARAVEDELVVGVDLLRLDAVHLEPREDARDRRLQAALVDLRQAEEPLPVREDLGRRRHAVRHVDHGGAAEARALQHVDRAVLGELLAAAAVEGGEHLVLALVEVAGGEPAALLDHEHVDAGLGEERRDDRAPGARSDHERVRPERERRADLAAFDDHTHGPSYPSAGQLRGSA
jgi:hypothetical protein